ncbi:MAG TPA: TetR family transcriptional regulator [Puia sp.]|jgi:AcrR family transcriptional regulator|nr:TetR family transcriptional regulator [Puia sp.]
MAKTTRSTKPKPAKESTTEERIKEAARHLFTQKGFAATRTRDIAEEAGINLALLNYYFRSKQKLFDLIMLENFQVFLKGITINLSDETMTFDQRIEKIVIAYIDMLTRVPDLPLFILNETRGNPSKITTRLNTQLAPMRRHLFDQLIISNKEGRTNLEPFHFVANLVGLSVFPFLGRPILQRVIGITDTQFDQFMQDRKTLVPIWIKAMLTPPNTLTPPNPRIPPHSTPK